ncbi:MAG TPA: alpha/beta hydrolase-fold protein [Dermatophilaceae bacterium]|nr:alpha/beta hydrolase-fold protein [Dermatophilaceae bacterium]
MRAADPPKVLDGVVRFRVPDAGYDSVELMCDRAITLPSNAFRLHDGVWELRVPRPPLRRFEYQLSVRDATGRRDILDPSNPATVPTAFGQRSVCELPGYRPPWWLSAPAAGGTWAALAVDGEVDDPVPVTMWTPTCLPDDRPAPLLLVHDGPEYDLLARVTQYCGALIHAATLPAHRVALLHPVDRDAWYSASPRYLRTEVEAGLAALDQRYAVSGPVVVMGASLGGLTALLAGLVGAPRIGGVFSQSGSFFRVVRDHETVSGYRYYDRITAHVGAVLAARHTDHPLRIGLTCGVLEENVANNRDMAASLRRAGHRVSFTEVPDLHNYTAWRDCLDPGLTEVLRDCWGAPGK